MKLERSKFLLLRISFKEEKFAALPSNWLLAPICPWLTDCMTKHEILGEGGGGMVEAPICSTFKGLASSIGCNNLS